MTAIEQLRNAVAAYDNARHPIDTQVAAGQLVDAARAVLDEQRAEPAVDLDRPDGWWCPLAREPPPGRCRMIPPGDLTPDWFDKVACHRALNGIDIGRKLHRAELLYVTRVLVNHGHGPSMVAQLTHCSERKAIALVKEVKCSV
jgi:hypothetical protein